MEVYFLDVGQGSCNVILTGNRQAIVIDTGRRFTELEKLLDTLGVNRISCLIISHLDTDHCGGAPGLITSFRNRIDHVYYPNDYRTKETRLWQTIRTEIKAGHLNATHLYRLERDEKPRQIWCSSTLQAELKLFSPTFSENQDTLDKNDANASSGVLVLHVGNHTIVFPGDSSLEQWKRIYEERGTSLDCDIVAIPHHAGIIWTNRIKDDALKKELNWLYQDALRPRHAVISVGTSNGDKHPRPEVIDSLKSLSVPVLCTQITKQCCAKLETLRPGLIPLNNLGRSSPVSQKTGSGKSKNLACAGTVVAEISPTDVTLKRLLQHQSAVDLLRSSGRGSPLCRN